MSSGKYWLGFFSRKPERRRWKPDSDFLALVKFFVLVIGGISIFVFLMISAVCREQEAVTTAATTWTRAHHGRIDHECEAFGSGLMYCQVQLPSQLVLLIFRTNKPDPSAPVAVLYDIRER